MTLIILRDEISVSHWLLPSEARIGEYEGSSIAKIDPHVVRSLEAWSNIQQEDEKREIPNI